MDQVGDYQKTILEAEQNFALHFISFTKNHVHDHDTISSELTSIFSALDIAHTRRMAVLLAQGVNALYPFLQAHGLYVTALNYLECAYGIIGFFWKYGRRGSAQRQPRGNT